MMRVCYVNGRYLPYHQATVHIEDRGLQFADSVYEVIALWQNHLVDGEAHLKRLARSLQEISLPLPMSLAAMEHIIYEVCRRNRVRTGGVYVQITRGVAPRAHLFPPAHTLSTLIITVRPYPQQKWAQLQQQGVSVAVQPDIRWKRCDIKWTGLLAAVLMKQAAHEQGAAEVWLTDEQGNITEATHSNVWIVLSDKTIVTPPANHQILNGITRQTIIQLAKNAGFLVKERYFNQQEAEQAAEAFMSGSLAMILPVIKIDGKKIGQGAPGNVTMTLLDSYKRYINKEINRR